MSAFRYISPREVDARHRAVRSPTARVASLRESPTTPLKATTPQKNVETVLSLGDSVYVTFQDRIYRIPPVPFRLGQRILELKIQITGSMKEIALYGTSAPTKAYYQQLAVLARVMWAHVHPIPRWHRVFRHLHLLRNPFRKATEQDFLHLIDFFLQCRMKSSVHSMSETPETRIQTFSTNSNSL